MAAWASLANFASTGLGMLALIITVPMTLPYLGQERFGVWMTVASFAGMLSFMDLGVGNGLINRVAAAKATGDHCKLQFTITHGLAVLSIIGLFIAALLLSLSSLLPWNRLIKVTSAIATEEARKAISIFVVLFAASIPIGGIQKILQGLQNAWMVHLVKGLGSLLSVVLVCFLARGEAGSPELLLATYGVQTFIPLLLIAIVVKKKLIGMPTINGAVWISETRSLVHIGGLFFVLQIGTLIGWGGDSLIVSSMLGASEVSKLVLVQRLFQFVTLPLMIINAPLWSAYADANARNDKDFLNKTLRKSLVVTLCTSILVSFVVTIFSSYIFALWTRESIKVPLLLVVYYSIWAVFEATGSAFAMFLNGVGEVRVQIFCASLFCMFALPLKYILVSSYGLPVIILATIMSYIVSHLIPIAYFFNSRIKVYLS
jgi:O-antigen/teichoic acid export membrane protein